MTKGQSARFANFARFARFSENSVKKHTKVILLGGALKPKGTKEADSGASNVAPLRSRESAPRKAGKYKINTRFNEAKASNSGGTKYEVILIQEGLGNLNDCFYYTKECLKNAVSVFNGRKSFADHPTEEEEEIRPERSTRDILGYFDSLEYREASDGRGMIAGHLNIPEDESANWARTLLNMAIDYAKKFPDGDFVGLSINASGEAEVIPIEDFMRENQIPSSVLPKLQQAMDEGITEIKAAMTLKDAVSCDLVTEAGAGGKILKMIEQERKPMSTKKLKESKAKEEKEAQEAKEAEATEKKSKEAETEDAGHDDEEQDKALIAKMIKQYLGDEHAENKEAMEMGKAAHEAYKSECKDPKEAYEKAGQHLKMAMKIGQGMAGKKKENESEAEEAEEGEDGGADDQASSAKKKKTSDSDGAEDSDHDESEESEDKESKGKAKESAVGTLRKQLIAKEAENARLKETVKKNELTEYLDKKLSESKKPMTVTKKFREALGTPKSKAHIDESLKIFLSAYEGKESEEAEGFASFVFTEKNSNHFEESSEEGKLGSLADCAE